MQPCFIGVDLAFAKNKYLPVVICTWEQERLIPKPLRSLDLKPPRGKGNAATLNDEAIDQFAKETKLYIENVCEQLNVQPFRIGIDAPSSPRNSSLNRRLSEKALDHTGISCFATPSSDEFAIIRNKVKKHLASGGEESRIPHANQLWMLVGFAIFKELSQLAPCLEVFPQATARAMGAAQIHKSRPGAVEAQLRAAAEFTGWLPEQADDYDLSDIAWGNRHDQLDAYLSAWVASLEEKSRVAYGEPPDDAIWVPKIQPCISKTSFAAPQNIPVHRPFSSSVVSKFLCPGCGKKEFKQWPLGWDAHAAYKCEGLASATPEARKSEYRRKFFNK